MLALLVPGVGMGGGVASSAVFVAPIGKKKGIVRADGPDINPVGLSGQVS